MATVAMTHVIIITWDDWGGWYDHVAPPIRNDGTPLNSYDYGFRVPLIVISPYAKPKHISHQRFRQHSEIH
ncbi:MAG: alkaline phosphatase family protein [Terriglobales bacterium]